jgi:cardiolipin synthase C
MNRVPHLMHLLRPVRIFRRLLAAAFTIGFVATLGACAGLPAAAPKPATTAIEAAEPSPLARLARAAMPADAASGESGFALLVDGNDAFATRLALIERAAASIDLQTYLVAHDRSGRTLLAALKAAAERGVRVRLLVDDLQAAAVMPLLAELDRQPGAEVRLFNPLPAREGSVLARLALSAHDFERVNRRMHNKLFVADGAFAVYGGRNIADEYFTRHAAANFVDIDIVSAGAVVTELAQAFDHYWNSEHAWPVQALRRPGVPAEPTVPAPSPTTRSPSVLHAAGLDPLGQPMVAQQLAAGRVLQHRGHALIAADPPSKISAPPVRYQATAAMGSVLDAIRGAREEVVLITPYFVPGPVGLQLLAEARRAQVRTRIVTNSLGSTDEPIVHRAYAAYRPALLELGVELYEFNPDTIPPEQAARVVREDGGIGSSAGSSSASLSRLHAKAALIDRRELLVGSVNLDPRSAVLNTELAVRIVSPSLAAQAQALLQTRDLDGMYRPRLSSLTRRLEWLRRDAHGQTEVLHSEPHDGPLARLLHALQRLFVSEMDL